jgi:hypothetical protein
VPEREDWGREEVLVVAAPKMLLRGSVVDEDGNAIAGAIVGPSVPGLVGFPFSLENAQVMHLTNTATNAQGEFTLPKLPDIAELELWVMATGFHRRVVHRQDDQRRIVLKRERSMDTYRIHGTVVDKGLHLIAGALVRVGSKETHTNARGHFDLGFKILRDDTHLFVGKKGHCTVTYDEHLQALRTSNNKAAGVVLTLGDAPKQIRGRVVDAAGEPMSGLIVALKDALYLDWCQTGEDLALGKKSKLDSSSGTALVIDARTDKDGSFVVGGLANRPYRLHIFDPKTLVGTLTAKITPGTSDLVVQFPKDLIFAELRGVVRSAGGQPLADVQVSAALRTFQSKLISSWAPGDTTHTDDEGRFVLKRVPRTGVHLIVSGGQVMGYRVAVETVVSPDEVVLVPPLRCHFRIRGGRQDADAIRLLDAEGKVVTIVKKNAQMEMSGQKWSLRGGRTTTLVVSDVARTLVYLSKDNELERKPVRLVPGQINDLK